MPDVDTQLRDYAAWLDEQVEPVTTDEARRYDAADVVDVPFAPADVGRHRPRRVIVAIAAAVLLVVAVAALLQIDRSDTVETGPAVTPGMRLAEGWQRVPVDWGSGVPGPVASDGEGVLRTVVTAGVDDCPPNPANTCTPRLEVWESIDGGETWYTQHLLSPGQPATEGYEEWEIVTALAYRKGTWLVAGTHSDRPIAWIDSPGRGWEVRRIATVARPGRPRAAAVLADGRLILAGTERGNATVWTAGTVDAPWTTHWLTDASPDPTGRSHPELPIVNELVPDGASLHAFGVDARGRAAAWSSSDGVTWSEADAPPVSAATSVVGFAGEFVAAEDAEPGQDRTVTLWSSEADGWGDLTTPAPWTWDPPTPDDQQAVLLPNGDAPLLAANGSGVVVAGTDGDRQVLWVSTDLRSWEPVTLPAPESESFVALEAHGDGFVALTRDAAWVWQPDGPA